ncbi:titin isoform X1 [Aedes albopictus]|uniref:LisH domain-containing protein n=2 Tax=Aedes albopictus TaxID=7160 RepID=A0ABM1ZS50_AEDAL
MEIIPNSYIARVVLAYLYEEKLNQTANEFCKASPYLREEREFVKKGFRPATCISLKLTALFREYGEIQQKVDQFVERHGVELDIQPDLPLVKKVDRVLTLVKQLRHGRKSLDDGAKKEFRKSAVGAAKRKRGAPSPHPSLSSSTPEVGEPQQKRVCLNAAPAFIVLNDSGRNLSNLSHISPIEDRGDDSTQESGREDDGEEEDGQDKGEAEEDPLDVRKFPSIDLFSQTLLENENYPEKIADLINKGLESSMSTQTDPKEGTSVVREEPPVKEVVVVESEPKTQECQSFNFNFDELISNIVNSAVKDPVFDDILDDISSKAVKTQNGNEEDETTTTPPPETPLKDRLRKTCRKNYNPASAKRSTKKVKVISDVPYYGGIPEGLDVEKSQPAAVTVVKVEPAAPVSESSNIPPETTIVPTEVQPAADQPVPMTSTTQFYVIQPDNTTKLVDINQLQFPAQQSVTSLTDSFGASQPSSTLIPITGTGIPEQTYFINVPSCYLESNNQLPVYFNAYPSSALEPSVSNPTVSYVAEPSPDKFLIFPSSSSETSIISTTANAFVTTSAVSSSYTSTATTTAINRICSSFVPVIPKPEVVPPTTETAVEMIPKVEVRATPQHNFILNTKVRSNSTPSRKASHIRILNFHTPAKQSPLATGTSARVSTPGSAPPSVDARPSRIPALAVERLNPILETSIKQEPSKTPEKLIEDIKPASGPALNPNSVSNTPRVAKDPRTCVRVLSRSTSEEATATTLEEAPKPMVEIPSQAVEEVQRKIPPPRILINDSEMEEWRRIRSVSKSNFDQHLRLMEEQRLQKTTKTPASKRRKKPTVKKAVKRKVTPVSPDEPITTPAKEDESLESMDRTDNSITEIHAQMLEDALASTKKPETEKSPTKTPTKGKTPAKEVDEDDKKQGSKIYVKITPRKKTPAKVSPKRRLSKGEKSAKKRRTSSPRKRQVVEKEEVKETEVVAVVEDKVVVVEVVEKTTVVEVKQIKEPESIEEVAPVPEPIPEPKSEAQPEPEPETPVKVDESSLSQVEETPPEPVPKPVKDHPKLLAKKSSAEYVRKEQEQSASAANTTSDSLETPPEKAPSVTAVDCSFGTSLFLETPFKADLASIPITPRFLMPNQIENTPLVKIVREGMEANSSIKKSGDIHTPNFPITPGLISTPKSINSVSPHSVGGTGGFSSRRTDYSSGSSYYKPDESEDLDKNIEAMLHGERRKQQPEVGEVSLEKQMEEEPPPQPEVAPNPESSPQKDEDHEANVSVSSSDSSSSSGSSSESSSSDASSPENTPVKEQPVFSMPSPVKTSTLYLNAAEARRQQQAELEAKKQRTIARMKNAKPAPLKKTERKFVAPPGFKSRKVIVARKEPVPKVAPPPVPPMRLAPSASSKRKNPTPRKVVLLEKILPVIPKKHSPKRKPEVIRKSPRSLIPITEQDVQRILTPRKDQIIEGTYESENLSRLRCTPDIPDLDPDRKPVYAFQSPERVVIAESDKSKGTPDSNKENLSLEEAKAPDPPQQVPKPEVMSESEDDEDFAYNECSMGSCYDDSECKSFVRLEYNDKKGQTSGRRSVEVLPMKKFNIVMEDRRICLETQDPILLFEESPKKLSSPAASPLKKDSFSKTSRSGSAKKSTKSSSKPLEPPAPVTSVPSTPSIKAKIKVVSGFVRDSSRPRSNIRAAARLQAAKQFRQQQQQREALAAAAVRKQKPDVVPSVLVGKSKTKPVPAASSVEESSAAASKELPVSPSPKMPLKLDMKKKQQQQYQEEQQRRRASSTEEPQSGNTESVVAVADVPKTENEVKETAPTDGGAGAKEVEGEFAIDVILTHIHG